MQRPVLETNSLGVSVPPPLQSQFQPHLKKKKKYRSSQIWFCTHKKYSFFNCSRKKLLLKIWVVFLSMTYSKVKPNTTDNNQERISWSYIGRSNKIIQIPNLYNGQICEVSRVDNGWVSWLLICFFIKCKNNSWNSWVSDNISDFGCWCLSFKCLVRTTRDSLAVCMKLTLPLLSLPRPPSVGQNLMA